MNLSHGSRVDRAKATAGSDRLESQGNGARDTRVSWVTCCLRSGFTNKLKWWFVMDPKETEQQLEDARVHLDEMNESGDLEERIEAAEEVDRLERIRDRSRP